MVDAMHSQLLAEISKGTRVKETPADWTNLVVAPAVSHGER